MYKKLLLNILVVLLILALLAILATFLWQLRPSNNLSSNNTVNQYQNNQNEIDSNELPPVPKIVEPANINRYEGTILAIQDNAITIATIFGEKVVEFDDQTNWQKIFLPKFPPIPGKNEGSKDIPEPETISASELASGQKIEVVSDHNISGQQKFLATEINLIIKYN